MTTSKKKSARKTAAKKSPVKKAAAKKKAAPKKTTAKKAAPKKKAASKKAAPKKAAAKKAAPKKAAPKKAAPKKAAAKKAAPKKAAPKKAAPKKAGPKKAAAAKKAVVEKKPVIEGVERTRKKKKKKGLTRAEVAAIAAKGRVQESRHPKLGLKFVCFQCDAKFYDLNRPEPICPKCSADQREKPKAAPTPRPAARKRKAVRPMAPLLDDDEDPMTNADDDELGRGSPPKTGDDLFDDATVVVADED